MAEDKTDAVLEDRGQAYGDITEGMVRIAQIWSGILGFEVQPVQVPLMMVGLKLSRASITPDYSDNYTDIEGYTSIARTVIGSDMIEASTSSDYVNKKRQRAHGITDRTTGM